MEEKFRFVKLEPPALNSFVVQAVVEYPFRKNQ